MSFHCPVCNQYLGAMGSKLHIAEIARERFTCIDCKVVFDGIGRQVDVLECPCCS